MPFHQEEQASKTMLWWMTQVLARFSLKPSYMKHSFS